MGLAIGKPSFGAGVRLLSPTTATLHVYSAQIYLARSAFKSVVNRGMERGSCLIPNGHTRVWVIDLYLGLITAYVLKGGVTI